MKTIKNATPYQQALSKVHLATNGIPYEDLERPVIGVVNSWNEIVPGHLPLRQIADAVKNGVRMEGGLPLEFNTIAVCDGVAQGHEGMRYPLVSRDLIADSIEIMVNGHGIFDGLVFLTGCDKITPGMLMAAARLNIPSIVISPGPVRPHYSGETRKRVRRQFLDGEINEQQLVEGSLGFYSTPGVCPFIGTASTMLIVAEALGMSLAGTSLIPAYSSERLAAAQRTGQRIVQLVSEGILPRDVMTPEAFMNAVRVHLALGGSLNALLHLPAIAAEAGLSLDWQAFDLASRETPLLTKIIPNGPHNVVDLHFAGGVPAVQKALGTRINQKVLTVNKEPLSAFIDRAPEPDNDILFAPDNPVRPEGGIAILHGNLAPDGGAVKQSAVREDLLHFRGPAKVFDSEEDCTRALEAGVPDGTVLVIRYEGPKGGPGMREMHRVTEMIPPSAKIAVVTDGRFSGASAGLSVGYICPEAADGGPIALVQDGDIIEIDIPSRQINLVIDESEMNRRKEAFAPPERPQHQSRLLASYAQSVGPANKGAIKRA